MNTGGTVIRIIKASVGVLVLVVILMMVNGWLSDYRRAGDKDPGTETTSTPGAEGSTKSAEPTPTKSAKAKPKAAPRTTVQVLMDGLNFRRQPETNADVIRGLTKGEKLFVLKKQGSWYQCEDKSGERGWLSANPSYTKVVVP